MIPCISCAGPPSPTLILVGILTGVLMLLYGVRLVSDALQRLTNIRVQEALARVSAYPPAAFGVGIVATGLMQSSSATASLLVELVSTSLLPMSTAFVMMLGANVGSTLVVQLLALHATDYAFEVVGLGAVIALSTHRTPLRGPGRALFAFGLILLGLATIGIAGQPLAASPTTKAMLLTLANAPVVLALMGALLAVLFNSSVATIGIVLTLTDSGALPPMAALAFMLGANLGTTIIPLLGSLNPGMLTGRRVALVHSGTKLLGVVCSLFLLEPISVLLAQITPNPATQVALAHLGFNVGLALLFIPLATPLARLTERLLPKDTTSPSHILDPGALTTPAVAQGLAARETLRMGDIATHMFKLSIQAFEGRPDTIQTSIKSMEDQLDELNAAIKGYLTQVDEEAMTEEQAQRDITLLTVVRELEAIGDMITNRFMRLAQRRSDGRILFSEEGWEDLLWYHQQIEKALQHVLAALATHNPRLAREFLAHKGELKQLKHNLHLSHIHQLRAGVPNSAVSSAIHLDLLDAMGTILEHASNIAHALREAA